MSYDASIKDRQAAPTNRPNQGLAIGGTAGYYASRSS